MTDEWSTALAQLQLGAPSYTTETTMSKKQVMQNMRASRSCVANCEHADSVLREVLEPGKRYRKAQVISQMRRLLPSITEGRVVAALARAREAGWLNYFGIGTGAPGLYWMDRD